MLLIPLCFHTFVTHLCVVKAQKKLGTLIINFYVVYIKGVFLYLNYAKDDVKPNHCF